MTNLSKKMIRNSIAKILTLSLVAGMGIASLPSVEAGVGDGVKKRHERRVDRREDRRDRRQDRRSDRKERRQDRREDRKERRNGDSTDAPVSAAPAADTPAADAAAN